VKRFLPAIFVACLLAGACGGGGGGERPPAPTPDRPPSPAPGNPTPPATVIRGNERLGWDQVGPSQAAVQGFTYVLYVDGSGRTLADVRCAAGATNGAAFPCSGQLPGLAAGPHTLELAAVDRGVEGPRSAPFSVTVSLSLSASITNAATPSAAAQVVCLDTAVEECYNALTIATVDGDVADLTMVPDGRVFFVENARNVRVIGPEGLAAAPALSAADDGERLVSLALAPDFLESRFVYVGSVEGRRGTPEFTLRRYREIAGVLGQGAALVTGLPVHEMSARVPVAVDTTGRLYVALPAADGSVARLSTYAFNGHVLRFARDGSVPADQASPILARGYARPSAIVYEANESRLWLAGSSGPWQAPVATLPLADRIGSDPLSAISESLPASASAPAIALRNRVGTKELWLANGLTYRATVANGVLQRLQSVETGLGDVSALAISQAGSMIVVRESSTGTPGSEIVRLAPRPSALIQ